MLPNKMPGSLQTHLAKVWRQLKEINDDELVCRISYQIGNPEHPDFLLIYQNQAAFLLAVSDATTEDVEGYLNHDFLSRNYKILQGLEGTDSLELFTNNVLQQLGAQGGVPMQHWLLFPNASDRAVSQLELSWQGIPRKFIGREGCRSKALKASIETADDYALDADVLRRIVGYFAPESKIPNGWITREDNKSGNSNNIQQDFLLDYNQEDAMKRDLELSGEAFKAASAGNLSLVTGTAGCGKTLILLFRARLSASLYDKQKVLVLMHNKPLRADLANRAKELGLTGNIEWRTFYSWINSMMCFDIISQSERDAFIEHEARVEGVEDQLTLRFLLKEFEWMSDNSPEPISLEWYLDSSRTGRKRSLQERQRRIVYGLYVKYRRMLTKKKKDDWSVAPRTFLKKLQDGELQPKKYQTIYIDEAQFFAPVWFRCVRAVLDQKYGRIFMVADPTQGFLRSGQSWVQIMGDDMRGRSQRLRKPYRNSQEIMQLARNFYLNRAITEDDEVNLPDDPSIARMPKHGEPDFVEAKGRSVTFILVEQIKQLLENHKNLGDILLIDASGYSEKPRLESLQQHFPDKIVSAAIAKDRSKMRVTTIGACTGIESPVVILVGLDRLFEGEESLGLDAIEREEFVRQNTKKVFVAITRASQRLVVIYRNESTLEKLLGTTVRVPAEPVPAI